MIDIVTWLREAARRHNNYRCDEAADRIETLEKALEDIIIYSADDTAIKTARTVLENKNDL